MDDVQRTAILSFLEAMADRGHSDADAAAAYWREPAEGHAMRR